MVEAHLYNEVRCGANVLTGDTGHHMYIASQQQRQRWIEDEHNNLITAEHLPGGIVRLSNTHNNYREAPLPERPRTATTVSRLKSSKQQFVKRSQPQPAIPRPGAANDRFLLEDMLLYRRRKRDMLTNKQQQEQQIVNNC